MEDRLFRNLGLCKRAGFLRTGAYSTEVSLKTGKSKLVIVAGDVSGNSLKKWWNMCSFRKVKIYSFSTKFLLGKALGKEECASVSVEDEGFAELIGREMAGRANDLTAILDGGNGEC